MHFAIFVSVLSCLVFSCLVSAGGRDVERIVIVGWGDRPVPKSVTATTRGRPDTPVSFEVGSTDGTLVFKRPGVKIDEQWEIRIEN